MIRIILITKLNFFACYIGDALSHIGRELSISAFSCYDMAGDKEIEWQWSVYYFDSIAELKTMN